jgi:SAM-dependent MidA family methyltransferase
MAPGAAQHPTPLVEQIRQEIESSGPIDFARFMELALYHPRHGYYARGGERLGTGGDFFTASDAGRGFGRSIAMQIAELDRVAGPFDPFSVIEYGAGRGLLARDVTDAIHESHAGLAPRLRYLMTDRSAAMRESASRTAPRARAVEPGELGEGHDGCVVAVELFDALPVRRVRRRGGELLEVGVAADAAGRLAECEIPADPEVAALAERYGAAADEGVEAELAPGLGAQLDTMQRTLRRGLLILVDYGFPAAELYDSSRRRGTLLAYRGHQTNEAFLEHVGEQDLTAHVNFTALEDHARALGLDVIGLTTQDRFLVANGILDYFDQQTAKEAYDPARVKQRMQAMQLIHPMGMGRKFKVLVLSKGIDPVPRLDGMRDPFKRDGA